VYSQHQILDTTLVSRIIVNSYAVPSLDAITKTTVPEIRFINSLPGSASTTCRFKLKQYVRRQTRGTVALRYPKSTCRTQSDYPSINVPLVRPWQGELMPQRTRASVPPVRACSADPRAATLFGDGEKSAKLNIFIPFNMVTSLGVKRSARPGPALDAAIFRTKPARVDCLQPGKADFRSPVAKRINPEIIRGFQRVDHDLSPNITVLRTACLTT